MIRNIVFDMGGVLIRFDREYFLKRAGLSPEDSALLMREVFLSIEWCQMDRGTLDEPEALLRMQARLPHRLHAAAEEMVMRWDDPILPIAGSEELIRELKEKGYRVYLLSNASHRQPEYWKRTPVSRYFDDVLVSSFYGVVKPMPEIYRLAYEKFGIDPAESVFIDDSSINAEGSVHCGMDAFVFHGDYQAFRRWLKERGVAIEA